MSSSSTMRAAIITEPGGPEVLQLEDVPLPEPAADQVRVRVHAAGPNRADLLQRRGGYAAAHAPKKTELTRRFAAHVVPLLAAGRVQPIVDRVFPLEDIAEAHRYMESNANFGKIIIDVTGVGGSS